MFVEGVFVNSKFEIKSSLSQLFVLQNVNFTKNFPLFDFIVF